MRPVCMPREILQEDGMFKLYSNKEHDVGCQCRIQYGYMQSRMQQSDSPYLASCRSSCKAVAAI